MRPWNGNGSQQSVKREYSPGLLHGKRFSTPACRQNLNKELSLTRERAYRCWDSEEADRAPAKWDSEAEDRDWEPETRTHHSPYGGQGEKETWVSAEKNTGERSHGQEDARWQLQRQLAEEKCKNIRLEFGAKTWKTKFAETRRLAPILEHKSSLAMNAPQLSTGTCICLEQRGPTLVMGIHDQYTHSCTYTEFGTDSLDSRVSAKCASDSP